MAHRRGTACRYRALLALALLHVLVGDGRLGIGRTTVTRAALLTAPQVFVRVRPTNTAESAEGECFGYTASVLRPDPACTNQHAPAQPARVHVAGLHHAECVFCACLLL